MVQVVEVPVCNVSYMGVASWAVLALAVEYMSMVAVAALYVLWVVLSDGVVVLRIFVVRVVLVLVCVPVPCMYSYSGLC